MWRRCDYWFGVLLIVVAFAAVPSAPVVESYFGGSAIRGSVEDGRYFLNPEHSQPVVEVSESTWRTVYWVERIWPFSAWVPGLIGLFLTGRGKKSNWKPPPRPSVELPPLWLRACIVGGAITVTATLLCWTIVREPWIVMLVGWVLFSVSTGTVGWLYTRSLRQQSAVQP
jgi:hypothetical protein